MAVRAHVLMIRHGHICLAPVAPCMHDQARARHLLFYGSSQTWRKSHIRNLQDDGGRLALTQNIRLLLKGNACHTTAVDMGARQSTD